jgi:hypothetical protein
MASVRLVCLGALAAVALVLVVDGAAAQSVDSADNPVPLLAGLKPPHATKVAQRTAHVKTFHVETSHKKVTSLTHRPTTESPRAVAAAEPVAPAAAPVPDNAWPTPPQATQAPPDDTAAATQSSFQAAPAAADDTPPNAVVMNGQTVEIASPDYLNDIDRAADDRAAPVVTEPSRDATTTVGSASWIAQVLAAFGGAAAAGAIAWFLIGSGPARMYG